MTNLRIKNSRATSYSGLSSSWTEGGGGTTQLGMEEVRQGSKRELWKTGWSYMCAGRLRQSVASLICAVMTKRPMHCWPGRMAEDVKRDKMRSTGKVEPVERRIAKLCNDIWNDCYAPCFPGIGSMGTYINAEWSWVQGGWKSIIFTQEVYRERGWT